MKNTIEASRSHGFFLSTPKEALLFLLIICLVLPLFTACGKTRNDGFSDRGFELACAVYEATNAYIDHKISADEAIKRIENASNELQRICDPIRAENGGAMTGTSVWRDGTAETKAALINHAIIMHDYGTEPMSKIEKLRDELKDQLWK